MWRVVTCLDGDTMSEAVDYTKFSTGPWQYQETDRWGTPTETYVTVDLTSQAHSRHRPKSTSTRRVGSSYVDPTNYWHRGTMIQLPLSTGTSCVGLSYGYKWSMAIPRHSGVSFYEVSDSQVPADLVNEAVTDCLLKLRDQKVNLGQALAEGRDTVKLVTNNAKRINDLLSGAARRNPSQWFRGVAESMKGNWKNIPGYYLEHIYGVQPLLSDIDGACQELARILNRNPDPFITVTGNKSRVEPIYAYHQEGQWANLRERGSSKLSVSVGVTASVPNWVMRDFDRLGLTNLMTVAWERVPYSHVIDWVLPVGNWLSALDVGNYLTFVNGFVTRYVLEEGQIITEKPHSSTVWTVRDDVPGRFRRYAMRRATIQQFPVASFPSLRNNLGLNQMAQGLAMLSQLVKGHIRQSR